MAVFGAIVDKMMGAEVVPCDQDDPRALALLGAGIPDREANILPETKLSDLGTQKELQTWLGNLSHLYISGSLAEDIIAGKTVGDVLSHLDKSKLEFVLAKLRGEELKQLSVQMHDDLDSLHTEIS